MFTDKQEYHDLDNNDNVIDVTNEVIELLKLSDNKTFDFFPEQSFTGDHPYKGNDKSIRILFKTNLDPEKTYLDQVTQDLLFNEGLIKQSRPNDNTKQVIIVPRARVIT